MKFHRLFATFIIIIITAGFMELATRLLISDDKRNPSLKAYADLARVQGFPESQLRKQLEYYAQGDTVKYYDYYLYAVTPGKSDIAEFTDFFSARNTPASMPDAQSEHMIWMFGGSTMQNMETTDELTIANTVAQTLRNKGLSVSVKNFGTGGFQSSMESIKFQALLRQPVRRPSMAVFYDGFNDALHSYWFGADRFQPNLGLKLADLVERKQWRLSIYLVSEALAETSRFWDRFIRPRVQKRYSRDISPHPDQVNRAVDVYAINVTLTNSVCMALQIKCLFVLQPLITSKKNLSEFEQKVVAALDRMDKGQLLFIREFYDKVKARMGKTANFVDLSNALDERTQPDFYDYGHTGPYTGRLIGAQMANQILVKSGWRPQ